MNSDLDDQKDWLLEDDMKERAIKEIKHIRRVLNKNNINVATLLKELEKNGKNIEIN